MSTHSFKPGDHVVHAVHGPATVVSVKMRETADGPREYVAMEVNDMRILIPASELEEVGVREPITREEAHEILELLAEDPLDDPGHAARRRRNKKRMVGGDAEALAKVVRSLRALKEERDKPLAYTDKTDLMEATDQLVGELAIALEVPEDEARQMVLDAVDGNTRE